MLNVRPNIVTPMLALGEPQLELVRAELKAWGWCTKMTSKTVWDPIEDRPRSTNLVWADRSSRHSERSRRSPDVHRDDKADRPEPR